MKTRNIIVTTFFASAIFVCLLCSGVVKGQPVREFHDEFREPPAQHDAHYANHPPQDVGVEFRGQARDGRHIESRGDLRINGHGNVLSNFARQIEAAYERGFRDGIAASDDLQKERHGGQHKFNRKKNYASKPKFKPDFYGKDFKHTPKERLHTDHDKAPKHSQKSNFHRDHSRQFAKDGHHKDGFHKSEFHKDSFRKDGFAQKTKQATHKNFFKGKPKSIAKNDFHKGEFKPSFDGKHGELKGKPNAPKREHTKKNTNKKNEHKKDEHKKPAAPFNERS